MRAPEDYDEHYSGFQAPDRPSCGGKRRKNRDQRRRIGKIMAVFKKKVSNSLAHKGNDIPKPNCRETKILDGHVGY